MLARVILMLLLALQALPAAAMPACHATPAPAMTMPMAHHGHHQPRRESQLPAEQLCLGCIAPATIGKPMFAPPLAFALPAAVPARSDGLTLPAAPPATPPPRAS